MDAAKEPHASDLFDVLIIGGGIHGVGVAQAAAACGSRTVLVEQSALAAGTSSKSSKLIHGGLRYLETASFSLVRENLLERERLLRLAPSLVHRRDFFLPIYGNARRRPWQVRCGLIAYAMLSGLRRETGFYSVPRREWDTLDHLETANLQAVFRYSDAQTDDVALTQAVMRSAQSLGAVLSMPVRFCEARWENHFWRCTCTHPNGDLLTISSRSLVNAAGPWLNRVRSSIFPKIDPLPLQLVQGTHLELPGKLTKGCYYSETLPDHRFVFVLPWKNHILLGTTEHIYDGDPARVEPTAEEKAYLLGNYARLFPMQPHDVLAAWAGLRVLPVAGKGSPFSRSRETILHAEPTDHPTVISILGGKLTGYRIAAARVMEQLSRVLPRRKSLANTAELPLV